MASAQSLALRSIPGYADRPSSTAAFTTNYPTLPTLPTLPALQGDASLPNYAARQMISNQLGQLGTQQNNAFSLAQAGAKQALAGYGGYSFQQDNPATPQREDLLVNFDPSKGPGAKEKSAYQAARGRSAAGGITEGTIANQNIASALQRTSLEAQSVVNQYATQINSIATDYANQGASLATQYAGLYGADATYALEHPPPPPPDWMAPAGTVGDVWAGYHQPDPAGLASMYPGMNFSYRTDPDGRVVVSASPIPQAPAAPAAPAPGTLAGPNSPAGSYPTWTGSAPPNRNSLAKAWGVKPSQIIVTPLGNGKYSAYPSITPFGGPGAGAFG